MLEVGGGGTRLVDIAVCGWLSALSMCVEVRSKSASICRPTDGTMIVKSYLNWISDVERKMQE
jgi:hypothetical protein